MLKRLVIIAFLTGFGQISTIFIIKWIAQRSSPAVLVPLAQIDSLFQLLINIIALGLQSAAMRNIVLVRNWQVEYSQTQSARFLLGLILLPLSLIAFSNPAYIIFLLAPVLALSGDYALYARGFPIKGSVISLVRVLIPYLLVLVAVLVFNKNISWYYFAGILIAYLITNLNIARWLHVKAIYPPRFSHLLLYIKTLPLGLVNLSFYFLGLGLLLLAPYLYISPTVAAAFVGLKFYVIVKGVLRIVHQTYIKDIVQDDICLRVDNLSMLVAISFLAMMAIFPDSTITLLFGTSFLKYKTFFLILGIAIIFYAFILSMATRALLNRKDKSYTILTTVSAFSAILAEVILSFFSQRPESIAISLLIGEIFFFTGLIIIMHYPGLMLPRFLFLLKCVALLLPLLFLRCLLGDLLLLNLLSIAGFIFISLFLHRKIFIH